MGPFREDNQNLSFPGDKTCSNEHWFAALNMDAHPQRLTVAVKICFFTSYKGAFNCNENTSVWVGTISSVFSEDVV